MKTLGLAALCLVGWFIATLFIFGDWEEASLQTVAEASVRQQLVDPDSARFDRPIVIKSERQVCGFVNAKNRMGGYVGRQLYIYSGGSAIIIADNHQLKRLSELKHFKDQISKCGPLIRT
jgi:hypothetical protein